AVADPGPGHCPVTVADDVFDVNVPAPRVLAIQAHQFVRAEVLARVGVVRGQPWVEQARQAVPVLRIDPRPEVRPYRACVAVLSHDPSLRGNTDKMVSMSPHERDRWRDELTWDPSRGTELVIQEDLAAAAWIEPRLVPESYEVQMMTPRGFEAYARVFFPFP